MGKGNEIWGDDWLDGAVDLALMYTVQAVGRARAEYTSIYWQRRRSRDVLRAGVLGQLSGGWTCTFGIRRQTTYACSGYIHRKCGKSEQHEPT